LLESVFVPRLGGRRGRKDVVDEPGFEQNGRDFHAEKKTGRSSGRLARVRVSGGLVGHAQGRGPSRKL